MKAKRVLRLLVHPESSHRTKLSRSIDGIDFSVSRSGDYLMASSGGTVVAEHYHNVAEIGPDHNQIPASLSR